MGNNARRFSKRSQCIGAPAVVGLKEDISRALSVHPRQVAEANRVAEAMGCGTPFRPDGRFVGTRAEKKRYMRELNRRRADYGQPRIVNFDGGYGDEI